MSVEQRQRAEMLVNTTGGICTYRAIMGLIIDHPAGGNDNELAGLILDGDLEYSEWEAIGDRALSSLNDPLSNETEDNDCYDIDIPELDEDEQITSQLLEFLGDMYPREKVIEVVRSHPNKFELEQVMDSVLEQVNITTVSGEWLRKSVEELNQHHDVDDIIEIKREDIFIPDIDDIDATKEERESLVSSVEFWKDSYFIFEEDVSPSLRHRRMIISDLLATELDRELAFDVAESLTAKRLRYTYDTILCVLRHHERKQNIDMVAKSIQEGIDISSWFDKDEEALNKLPTVDCEICYMDYSPADMYTVHCDSKHSFCYDCLQGSIGMNINEGTIALCPWGGCDHVITEMEVVHIFGEGEMLMKFSKMLLKVGIAELENCVGCPTPGCENWIVLPDTDSKVKVSCDGCEVDFCSKCRELYHFGTSCDESKEITVKWIKWVDHRDSNLDKLKEVQALKDRISDFEKDEEWKSNHLKCCNHCGRAVEKLEGCDLMVCGEDYHKGNKQRGCGKQFTWSGAVPYQKSKDVTQKLLKSKVSMNVNENVLGFGPNGVFGICEYCKEEIQGVGFQCVNCPCYTVCYECEDKMEGHNGKHIFRVLGIEFKEEEEKEVKKRKTLKKKKENTQLTEPTQKDSLMGRLFRRVKKKKIQLLSQE